MTWETAAKEWADFLEDINQTRTRLRCSWTSPWFRGHTDSTNYKLIPGLLRKQTDRDASRIKTLQAEITSTKPTIAKCKSEIVRHRKVLSAEHKAGNNGLAASAQKSIDDQLALMDKTRKLASAAQLQIDKINLVPTGEREAFIEFSARAGQQFSNSWEVLAAMQHCGVPTRLLDWSETLSAALFFALRKYSVAIDAIWLLEKKKGSAGPFSQSPTDLMALVGPLPTPSVWVLNPFRASARATDRNRIWDISRQPEYDYFQRFVIQKSWDFENPIPAFSPWRSPRMAAQQGTFVVWGRDRRPLDQILGVGYVAEVKMSAHAAIYGVYLLKHMLAIDHFSMFRDLDSLSAIITERYIK